MGPVASGDCTERTRAQAPSIPHRLHRFGNAKVQKWGNIAAVRLPATALKDAGMQVGQSLELRVEEGRLVMEPASESLEDLLAKITPENQHGLALEGRPAVGAEVW